MGALKIVAVLMVSVIVLVLLGGIAVLITSAQHQATANVENHINQTAGAVTKNQNQPAQQTGAGATITPEQIAEENRVQAGEQTATTPADSGAITTVLNYTTPKATDYLNSTLITNTTGLVVIPVNTVLGKLTVDPSLPAQDRYHIAVLIMQNVTEADGTVDTRADFMQVNPDDGTYQVSKMASGPLMGESVQNDQENDQGVFENMPFRIVIIDTTPNMVSTQPKIFMTTQNYEFTGNNTINFDIVDDTVLTQ